MTDEQVPDPPMKPQDTLIWMLGGMSADLKSIKDGQAAAAVSHASAEAANTKEHEEFRRVLSQHGTDIAVLKSGRVDDHEEAVEASSLNDKLRTRRITFWGVVASIPLTIIGIVSFFLANNHK